MSLRRTVPILAISAAVAMTGTVWSKPPKGATGPTVGAEASQVPEAVGEKTLRSTIFRNNNQVVNKPSGGFQAIHNAGGVVVTCPGPGTCAIEVNQYIQVGNSPAAGNRFAVCSQIDGAFISSPNCPFLGIVPTSGFQTGAFMQFKTAIQPGDHVIQTFLYTDSAATRALSSNAYRVYKP